VNNLPEIEKRILQTRDPEERMRLIIRFFGPKLYAVIRPLVKTHENTDDVLQETLLKIHQNINRFQGKSRLYTWMYRIAYNESMQFIRKNFKTLQPDNPEIHRLMLEQLKADIWFSGNDAARKLEEALAKLPPRQAEVFRLKYFSELKYRDISEILGISEGALKTHYFLAVKKIKEYLECSDPFD
jgi:RNA polymerase sigma-70 factor (ECF subfamily)